MPDADRSTPPPSDEETSPSSRRQRDEPTLPGRSSREQRSIPTRPRLRPTSGDKAPPSKPEEPPARPIMRLPAIKLDDEEGQAPSKAEVAKTAAESGLQAPAEEKPLPAEPSSGHQTPPVEDAPPPGLTTPVGLRPIPARRREAPRTEPSDDSPPKQATPGSSTRLRLHLPEEVPMSGSPSERASAPKEQPQVAQPSTGSRSKPPTASTPFPDLSGEGTRTGDLPEVVDAEWVVDLDRKRREAGAPNLWTTFGELPVVIVRRWGVGRLLAVLAAIVVVGVLVFAPITLRSNDNGSGNMPIGGPTTPGGTPTEQDSLPGAGSTPTLTPHPPFVQGRIAFSSNRDGDFEVYIFDLVMGNLAQLTHNEIDDREPAWSPDGGRIVFVSNAAGDDDLYLIDLSCLAGGDSTACEAGRIALTGGSAQDRSPAWSPDGSRIVFSRETPGGSRLLMFHTDCLGEPGACENNLIPITGEQYFRFPAWSPTGGRIVLAAADFPGLPSVIALVYPDGSSYTPLRGTGASDFDPAWSPDGTRLAFTSNASIDHNIWLMSPSGDDLRQVTTSQADDVEPAWSPDGTFLVFASDRGSGGDFELILIPVNCEGQTCEERAISVTDNLTDDLNPAWSP